MGLRAAAATSEAGDRAGNHFGAPGPPEAPHPPLREGTTPLPGSICMSPRQQRATQQETDANASIGSVPPGSRDAGKVQPGKAHVGKALSALGTSAKEGVDIDSALAMLDAEEDDDDDDGSRAERSPSTPLKFPADVFVAPPSRVMVLTWARWARNSLRIKAELKLKALQHVRYPKAHHHYIPPPQTPPLSPQSTPRGGDCDERSLQQSEWQEKCRAAGLNVDQGDGAAATAVAPPPSRGGGKRHPATVPRGRTPHGVQTEGKLLFDVMADERREAQEEQAMKKHFKKNFFIEEAHTDSDSTPGFGLATPSWGDAGSKAASRMSPKDSVVSSGVASPMAGGQMSPWLLEAEALVNSDDYYSPESPAAIPHSNAWGFEPARLFDVPEAVSNPSEELDDIIGDADELEGVFLGTGVPESPGAQDVEGQHCSPELLGSDSLASTATSPSTHPPTGWHVEKESIPSPYCFKASPRDHRSAAVAAGSGSPRAVLEDVNGAVPPTSTRGSTKSGEYAIGEKVSYWSSSRGVWLPAVIVEKKSSSVYFIDKQMKGCFAKVRTSELISRAEEQTDPILRALAAFNTEPASASRPATPRGSTWQPPGSAAPTCDNGSASRSARDEGKVGLRQRPQQGTSGATFLAHEPEAGKPHRKGDRLGALQKAPTIKAALPPALAAVAGPTSRSPRQPRGKIVRDDFSDDSDDD